MVNPLRNTNTKKPADMVLFPYKGRSIYGIISSQILMSYGRTSLCALR